MRNPIPIILCALAASACASTPSRSVSPARGPGGALEGLLASDANGDGSITRAEFTQAREQRFAQFDRNHDGYLSREDAAGAGGGLGRRGRALRRGGQGGERLREAMAAVDADGDGRVSRTEFVDGPGRLFQAGDINRDDRLDRREIEELRARLAARRGG